MPPLDVEQPVGTVTKSKGDRPVWDKDRPQASSESPNGGTRSLPQLQEQANKPQLLYLKRRTASYPKDRCDNDMKHPAPVWTTAGSGSGHDGVGDGVGVVTMVVVIVVMVVIMMMVIMMLVMVMMVVRAESMMVVMTVMMVDTMV